MQSSEPKSVERSKPADPRTELAEKRTGVAAFRTRPALDRTTLAWIRTTLTMASSGFGLVAFFRSIRAQSPTPEAIVHTKPPFNSYTLVVLGIVATVLSGVAHWRTVRRLRRGEKPVLTQWPLRHCRIVSLRGWPGCPLVAS